ncbi:MAG: hypothetical protein V2J24_12945 [Pseudomonadales bacterium]|nr:hypothetical protein [Pseudomonadales bacterium]
MRVLVPVMVILLLAAILGDGAGAGARWNLLNGAGFAACGLFVGLSWLSASPARQPGLDAHSDLALWICLFATIHALGLLAAEPTLLEYLGPGAPVYMLVGVLALLVLLALTAASYPGPRQRVWRSWPAFRAWHRWLWLGLLLAIAWHVLGAGFYLDTPAARLLGLGVLVLLPLGFWLDRRLLRDRPRPQEPGPAFNGMTGLCAFLATVLFAVLKA